MGRAENNGDNVLVERLIGCAMTWASASDRLLHKSEDKGKMCYAREQKQKPAVTLKPKRAGSPKSCVSNENECFDFSVEQPRGK